MDHTSTVRFATDTLRVPDALLHHEVRGQGPLVVLIGAPMDANAFAPLADLLAVDHTVLTADPRGINRSRADNPGQDSTPEMRADDLARLITHVNAGSAVVFGSSGGAVTALALTQAHPELVHTVIAHEPPLIELLDDRTSVRAKTDDYVDTYLAGDVVGAWTKFFAEANIAMPDGVVAHMFGGDRDPQVVADEHFWFAHELRLSTYWLPDLAALRAAGTRILIGIGAESTGQSCDRTSTALGAQLDIKPTMFPGGHIGFTEDVAGFATRLRAVLRDA